MAYIISCLVQDYALQTARGGKEGIEAARKYIPDVILCDVMMAGMNGFEVCRQLKSERRTSHIPVILLSGKATTQEDKVIGLRYGADAYLIKPFDKEELLVRLGDRGNSMFLIQKGNLEIILDERDDTPIATRSEGEFLGEMSLFTGEPRSATVRSSGESPIILPARR